MAHVCLYDSALVPYTVEGMGVPTKEDRLSIGLSVLLKPFKSVTTAGGPAAHTQDFPLFSVELARPSASLVISRNSLRARS